MMIILVLFLGQADPNGLGSEEPSFGVSVRGGAVWAFAWGAASAKNSFTRFERGEDIDLRDDLGLVHGDALAELALEVRFEHRHRIVAHSLFGDLTMDTVLDRTFEYNDNVFAQGERAKTRREIDLRDLEDAARFVDGPTWTLWAGAGGRWEHVNVGVRSSTLDPGGSMEAGTTVYPTLNAGVTLHFGSSLSLALDLRGSPAALPLRPSHASPGRFGEVRPTLAWNMAKFVRLELGGTFLWTWHRWKGRESDGHFAVNEVDLRLAGPLAELEISF